MILLARGISGLAERLVGSRLGRLQVELAFVERAPGDRADDALWTELGAAGGRVGGACAPARGDDRRLEGRRGLERRLDVDAGHHAVAADIGVDDRLHAVLLEFAREVYYIVAGHLGPALARARAFLGVEPGDDVAGKGVAGVGEKAGILHRRGAHHDVGHPGIDVALD